MIVRKVYGCIGEQIVGFLLQEYFQPILIEYRIAGFSVFDYVHSQRRPSTSGHGKNPYPVVR